jgi:hypothetical protein
MDLPGCGAGIRCATTDLGDAAGNLCRALRRLLNVAGDLLGRSALLFDGCRNDRRNFRDLGDRVADLLDRRYGMRRCHLHLRDLCADLFRRLRRLPGECLDFGGDDSEVPACFAGTGGLYRRIERQEICLRGDGGDQLDDLTDAIGGL